MFVILKTNRLIQFIGIVYGEKKSYVIFLMVFYNMYYTYFQSSVELHVDMVMHPFQQDQVNLADHENLVVLLDLLHPEKNFSSIEQINTYYTHTFSPFSPGGP